MVEVIPTVESGLLKREKLILVEIGRDQIDSASAFVEYINSSYGFSKSSVWYNLKRLKEKGMLDFASRDEPGKRLELTTKGCGALHALSHEGRRIMESFIESRVVTGTWVG